MKKFIFLVFFVVEHFIRYYGERGTGIGISMELMVYIAIPYVSCCKMSGCLVLFVFAINLSNII